MEGLITTIQRMSLHDGPGIRSTLFLKGCNFRCKWCHNPETWSFKRELQYISSRCIGCYDCVSNCSTGAIKINGGVLNIDNSKCIACGNCASNCASGALSIVGRSVTPEAIVNELMVDSLFFKESAGGVTISGGEPFCQPEFLVQLLKECKLRGLSVAIETNLSCNLDHLKKALPYVDYWFVDLKTMDDEIHKEWIGASNSKTISNIKWLSNNTSSLTIRTPVIPGFNDNIESIKEICDFLTSCSIVNYEVLPFHTLGYDKFTQIGYTNPMSLDISLDKDRFAALKEFIYFQALGRP